MYPMTPETCPHASGTWGGSASADTPARWRCRGCGQRFAAPPEPGGDDGAPARKHARLHARDELLKSSRAEARAEGVEAGRGSESVVPIPIPIPRAREIEVAESAESAEPVLETHRSDHV